MRAQVVAMSSIKFSWFTVIISLKYKFILCLINKNGLNRSVWAYHDMISIPKITKYYVHRRSIYLWSDWIGSRRIVVEQMFSVLVLWTRILKCLESWKLFKIYYLSLLPTLHDLLQNFPLLKTYEEILGKGSVKT